MWFRNLQIYRLSSDWNITAQHLDEQLAQHVFQPCGSMDRQSRGWVSPRGDERLAYALNGQIMLALRVEQKLLPGSVVNDVAKDRIVEFEQQQGYSPSRKQAREIKERVAEELLPRAFARRRTTYVWIDPSHGWLAIDAASAAKADEVLEMLNKCISDLPLSPLRTERSPAAAMTEWLTTSEAPAGFSIDRDCELRSPVEENATVRYVRHPLDAEEISKHITAGKQPTRLALTWDDRISFVLTDRLEIKRLAFLDILKEEAEASTETADEQFDADFALMTGELARLLPAIVAALGGEHAA
ncbi:MAG: recombination-associated protein RdgC [Sulfurimicrobium sp.]|nr:recombination-associated protein RdgC [Sulfurimicrobium sp.]